MFSFWVVLDFEYITALKNFVCIAHLWLICLTVRPLKNKAQKSVEGVNDIVYVSTISSAF